MKESTARIGDGRKKEEGHDKTVSECFPCLWPEINKNNNNITSVRVKIQLNL